MKKFYLILLGVFLFSCEKETLYKNEQVIHLAVDSVNAVWFHTSEGLARLKDQQWSVFDIVSQGIPQRDIRGFYTHGKNFYVYTNHGYLNYDIFSLPFQPLEKVNKASAGFFNDTILSLLYTDRLWVICRNGISFLKNGRWVHKWDTLVTGIAVSHDTCYVSTAGYGVSRYIYTVDAFTGASSYNYSFGGQINDTVYTVLIAGNSEQWYGTAQGVFRHIGTDYHGLWMWYTDQDGLPDKKVITRLYEDKKGRIWAVSESGIAYFDGSKFHPYLFAGISGVAEDGEGNVWFGGVNGLVRFDGNFVSVSSAEGLPDTRITSLASAPDGSVWIGTQKGAVQIKNNIFTVYPTMAGK